MITYENRPLWRRTWVWVSALVLPVLVFIAWRAANPGAPDAPPPAAAPSSSAGWVSASVGQAPEDHPPVSTPTEDGRPADFSAEEWAALKEATGQSPDAAAELRRIVAYMRFQRGVERWQALQTQSDTVARHRLGQQLLAQLPDRVRQSEVTMGEAIMLASAVLADLEPDDALRKTRLDQVRSAMQAAAPQTDAEQQAREAARLSEYKRREAAIVAEWQARPAGERSQARLEEALEAARRAVYSDKK